MAIWCVWDKNFIYLCFVMLVYVRTRFHSINYPVTLGIWVKYTFHKLECCYHSITGTVVILWTVIFSWLHSLWLWGIYQKQQITETDKSEDNLWCSHGNEYLCSSLLRNVMMWCGKQVPTPNVPTSCLWETGTSRPDDIASHPERP